MKKDKRFWLKCGIGALAIVAVVVLFVVSYFGVGSHRVSHEFSVEEAQTLVDNTFGGLAKRSALAAVHIMDNTDVTVTAVSVGNEKDMTFHCTYTTYDTKAILMPELDNIFTKVYAFYRANDAAGKKTNATKVNLEIRESIEALLTNSSLPKLSGTVELKVYELAEGDFRLYLSDEVVSQCTGGLPEFVAAVKNVNTVTYGGETVNISNLTTLRTGVADSVAFNNYSSEKPIVGTPLKRAVEKFKDDFYRNFIQDNRWTYLANGLGTTLAITALSAVAGAVLGFLVAVIRCTNESTGRLGLIDRVCRLYLTVIRGTPLMVQLLIIYFVILLPIGTPKFLAAVICFALNSGAYVAEIVRGGIMSVDKGQMEAGRSLGFGYAATMYHFIMPQAFKAVLPSLANEFITLLKESSVAFYIGVADLTQGGLKIRSITFSNFLPLIAVAIIYLVLVMILTRLVGLLERRLRKSER